MGDKNHKTTTDIDANKAFSFFDGNRTIRVEGPAYVVEQYQRLAGSLGSLAQAEYYLKNVCVPAKEVPVEIQYLVTKTAKTLIDMIAKDVESGLVRSVI